MAISNSYNFRQISDKLTTSGVVGAGRLKGLADEGYTAVINLLPDSSEYAVPDEQAIVEGQGVEYIYIPVNFAEPTEPDFECFCQALDDRPDSKLHIHCAANYRVSAFYARYAVSRGLWSKAEAQTLIEGLWDPQAYAGWPEFMDGILS